MAAVWGANVLVFLHLVRRQGVAAVWGANNNVLVFPHPLPFAVRTCSTLLNTVLSVPTPCPIVYGACVEEHGRAWKSTPDARTNPANRRCGLEGRT